MFEIFKSEIKEGLSATPKTLPSKYFYNKKGDALFTEIMDLPEYYLTRSELDIFQNKTQELIDAFNINPETNFELIELGAGDGLKTKELLKFLLKKDYKFEYMPVDISSNALNLLEQDLATELPSLTVKTQHGDYFEILNSLKGDNIRKIVLFLGSNIGNMTDNIATQFIYDLGATLQKDDILLLGVDLIKPKEIVLPAYNDSKGVTAQFNLNLLERINNELGGGFELENFKHHPEYDEEEGIAKSFIVSTSNQKVEIKELGITYEFVSGEKIHTEISRKYNDQLIEKITSKTDFSLKTKIMDSKEYFADYILERK